MLGDLHIAHLGIEDRSSIFRESQASAAAATAASTVAATVATAVSHGCLIVQADARERGTAAKMSLEEEVQSCRFCVRFFVFFDERNT